jgi:hypothetical protein
MSLGAPVLAHAAGITTAEISSQPFTFTVATVRDGYLGGFSAGMVRSNGNFGPTLTQAKFFYAGLEACTMCYLYDMGLLGSLQSSWISILGTMLDDHVWPAFDNTTHFTLPYTATADNTHYNDPDNTVGPGKTVLNGLWMYPIAWYAERANSATWRARANAFARGPIDALPDPNWTINAKFFDQTCFFLPLAISHLTRAGA